MALLDFPRGQSLAAINSNPTSAPPPSRQPLSARIYRINVDTDGDAQACVR